MLSTLPELAVVFASAKVGGEIMVRLRQPAVIGELLAGVVLGPSVAGLVTPNEPLRVLAQIGVVVLLFLVGLETRPDDLRRTGRRAALVAALGVGLTFAGGLGAARIVGLALDPALFVATAIVATSVSISARVLAETGMVASLTGRLILGAALIDDILGLIILAIIAGLTRGTLHAGSIVVLGIEVIGFVALAVLVAPRLIARVAHLFELPRIPHGPFAVAIAITLGLSAAANTIGLAAVIGAFLAGTALAETDERYALQTQARPLGEFLSPFFFVVTGTEVDLRALGTSRGLTLALLITLAAVAGKTLAALVAAPSGSRLAIGFGMLPRGEVGIIVAALALGQGVIGHDVFAAIIAMVLATTLVAPPLLKLSLSASARMEPPRA